jgi:peptidoglycan/LPS O-acetylase OafA/YrhL
LDHRNFFQLLRLVAALTIIWAHQHDLSGVARLGPLDLAQVALLTFFSISGYLNTVSLLTSRDPRRFLVSRFLRIYPALVGGAAFMVCLGAIVTSLGLLQYLHSGQVWMFVVRNVTLIGSVSYKLPGVVFPASQQPNSVNGSLWTLPYEVDLYLFLVGLLLLFRYRTNAFIVALAAALIGATLSTALDADPKLLPGIRLSYMAKFAVAFFAGGLIAACELRGIAATIPSLACLTLGLAAATAGQTPIAYALIVASIVVHFGRLHSPQWMIPRIDISYGVYIYAFPVQQVVIGYQLAGFWAGLLIALAATILLATISYVMIEAPALSLKRRTSISGAHVPIGDRLVESNNPGS